MINSQHINSHNATYDAVVIGGGINGVAAARELAKEGYCIALVEADDLASGASGRSSRMLHCGLRYFETPHPIRDFGLAPTRFLKALRMARESMQARADLSQDQAVSTRRIELCFPIWKGGPIPRWQLSTGLRLLQAIAPPGPPLDTKILGRNQALEHPMATDLRDRDSLTGMATFQEYLFEAPERMCVDAAVEAHAHGAEILLHNSAKVAEQGPDGLWRIEVEGPDSTRDLHARCVLNLAGTWTDDVGLNHKRLSRGTKGAHIILKLPERYRDKGIATLHRGRHPFYCLPMGQDLFYFGPTETPFEGDARDAHATSEDIDFLLAEANYLLPRLNLQRRDILQTWAGVRPLTFDPTRPMGARERTVHDLKKHGVPNVVAMTAGPLMSHRSAGRLLADKVRSQIGPGSGSAQAFRSHATAQNVSPVATAVTQEFATDLYGVLVQRTGSIWKGLVPRAQVIETANEMAELLGWDDAKTHSEIERFLALQDQRFGVPAPSSNELST